jgi:tight adherence protein B
MIPVSAIVAVLALVLCATAITLWLDARQRRMDRQIEIALPVREAARLTSIRRRENSSRWQLFQKLVGYRAEVPHVLHPPFVLLAGGLAAAGIFYVNRLFGFSTLKVSLAAGIVAVLVVRGLFRWQQARFTDQLFRQLPDTIQLVTSAVRSGLPVSEALRIVAREMPEPTAGQFALVCSELSLGQPPDEAVEAVYWRTRVPEYAMFAATLAVQKKAGGSLSETLQTLGDTVTQRAALAARAKALAGEVIFSSRALVAAPFIIGGLQYLANRTSIDMLFYDPTGNKLLAYAACSTLLGYFVMRWMIKRETAL